MLNFQGIIFISTQTYRKIFKFALVYQICISVNLYQLLMRVQSVLCFVDNLSSNRNKRVTK